MWTCTVLLLLSTLHARQGGKDVRRSAMCPMLLFKLLQDALNSA